MKQEDEHSLKSVENGEDVGKDDHVRIDVGDAKHPGDTQQTQQDEGAS